MTHPYIGLPDYQFWKKEAGIRVPASLDPVVDVPFLISPNERIVSAGSCFAQNIARYCQALGFNYYFTEPPHPFVNPKVAYANNYNIYSARYGNIYTCRQLRQLLLRAYGHFIPLQTKWKGKSGNLIDPFRPNIQPRGFISEAEMLHDRESHFRSVRKAIEQMNVFIFTLGLTEAWVDSRDNAVFPIAPGILGGEFDPDYIRFTNFSASEVINDLSESIQMIRKLNPNVKIILTVSPVPLSATYENRHVLVSTTLSKSALRIAAELITRQFDNCAYFPSYEIITSPHVRGAYFEADCRSITELGVQHVMRLLFSKFSDQAVNIETDNIPPGSDLKERSIEHARQLDRELTALCEEEFITNEPTSGLI